MIQSTNNLKYSKYFLLGRLLKNCGLAVVVSVSASTGGATGAAVVEALGRKRLLKC